MRGRRHRALLASTSDLTGSNLSPGENGLGEHQILGGGQLDVGLLSGDDLYATSIPLDQGSVIGRGSEQLFGRVVEAPQQAKAERLGRLDRPQVRPVQGLGDDAFPGDLDSIRDGNPWNDTVRFASAIYRPYDTLYEVGCDQATRPVVHQHDSLRVFLAEEQAVPGREGAGFARLGAGGVLADAGRSGEGFDPLPVADGIDSCDLGRLLEGLQRVVEGRHAEEFDELLGTAHPAACPAGEN